MKPNSGKPVRKRVKSPFAENLKQLLAEKKISQREAAKIAGISPATFNQWLSGNQPNSLEAVLKLSQHLNCNFQWLLTGVQPADDASKKSLTELFEIEPVPTLSGCYFIEMKKMKRRTP